MPTPTPFLNWLADIAQPIIVVMGIIGIIAVGIAVKADKDDVKSRREEQAKLVSASYNNQHVAFVNASASPVFNVIASLVNSSTNQVIAASGEKNGRAFCGHLNGNNNIQNGTLIHIPKRKGADLKVIDAVELAFTDGSGRNWLRTSGGRLKSISQLPSDYYSLYDSLPWGGEYDALVTYD